MWLIFILDCVLHCDSPDDVHTVNAFWNNRKMFTDICSLHQQHSCLPLFQSPPKELNFDPPCPERQKHRSSNAADWGQRHQWLYERRALSDSTTGCAVMALLTYGVVEWWCFQASMVVSDGCSYRFVFCRTKMFLPGILHFSHLDFFFFISISFFSPL